MDVNQPALFDANKTSPQPCPAGHCAAIKFPHQDRVPTCAYDLHREGKRPKGCLNEHRPEHAQIPY